MSGKNPLSITHPELAKEALGWDPASFSAGSGKKMTWKCFKDHIWDAQISNRTNRKSGCPYCSGARPIIGETDLLTKFPHIGKEANGWDPTHFTAGSNANKKWKCVNGHSWESSIHSRTSQSTKCPTCRGTQLLKGFNDFATKFPNIALEAYGWDPSEVSIGNRKVSWKCKDFGHIWDELISGRINGYNCPYCSGQRLLVGFNDLATTHPELASEAYGWDPKSVSRGSRKRQNWKCKLGHIWEAQPNDRTGRESGCPYCAGRKLLVGFNDIATTHPQFARQAHGWNPNQVMPGYSKNLEWICEKGHIWRSSPISRTTQDTGCTICLNKVLLVGYNDLATTHPEITREAHGWDPKTVIAGSNKRLLWQCEYGHIWKAQPNGRTRGFKTGCPTCAKYGFDPNEKGWLYFLNHPNWEMLQIGITNFPENRLATHKKLGWEVIELRGPMDGLLTREWETSILRMLRRYGAQMGNHSAVGKFDGYSEAWITKSFPIGSLKELMDLVNNDEM